MAKPFQKKQKNRTPRVNPFPSKAGPTVARMRALDEMSGHNMPTRDLYELATSMPVTARHLKPRGAPGIHIPNQAERKATASFRPRKAGANGVVPRRARGGRR